MRDLEKAKPTLECARCGLTIRTFDCYLLGYKLGGLEHMKKLHFCSSCWAEGRYIRIVDQIKDSEQEIANGE